MSEENQQAQEDYLIIKGAITEFPADIQTQIHACAEKIEELIKANPDGVGLLALALVGAKFSAKGDDGN